MKWLLVFGLLIIIFTSGCTELQPKDNVMSVTEAKIISEGFIKSHPTYALDSVEGSLILDSVYQGGCNNCMITTYYFESNDFGYGPGKTDNEIFTPHTVDVLIKDREVVAAIIDHKWDEVKERYLEKYTGDSIPRNVSSTGLEEIFVGDLIRISDNILLKLSTVNYRECSFGKPCDNTGIWALFDLIVDGYTRKVTIEPQNRYQIKEVSIELVTLRLNSAVLNIRAG